MSIEEKIDPVLIDVPMPVVTERLEIRPFQDGDETPLVEAVHETWDDLKRWMPWAADREKVTISDYRAYVRKKQAEFILRDDITLVGIERTTQTPVLWTGVHRMNWDLRHFEIGYWVRQSAQKRGYATEGTNALLRYAFGALDAARVTITHAGGNAASKRVIEKLGFEKEGVLKNFARLPDGAIDDHVLYARLDLGGLPDLKVDWGRDE